MRFAIATGDRHLGVFNAFVHAGWQPLKLFTSMKNEMGNQKAVITYAEERNVGVQVSPVTERDMHELCDQGCDALIVATYDRRIPDWNGSLKYAVNFHPSPLPHGRGPYPQVRAITEKWDHWGVTCHQLTAEFDKGDILATEKFPLGATECHESLDLKIQMAAKKLAASVANKFEELWKNAEPQSGGSFWKKPKLIERVLNFDQPTENILRSVRAYGSMESLAKVNDTWLLIKQAVGWVEKHNYPPGNPIHVYDRSIVVSAKDGYIGLLDIKLAPPQVIAEVQAYSPSSGNQVVAALDGKTIYAHDIPSVE